MTRNTLDDAADMVRANDKRAAVIPLGNVLRMQKTRLGCEVVIGAPEQVMVRLAQGKLRGGLLLISEEEW